MQRTESTKYIKEFVLLIRHLSHNVTHSKFNTYAFFSPESCLLFLSKNMIQLSYRTFALFTKVDTIDPHILDITGHSEINLPNLNNIYLNIILCNCLHLSNYSNMENCQIIC